MRPRHKLLVTIALAAAASAALARPIQPAKRAAPSAEAPLAEAPPAEMQKLLQNCDAHKFETIVDSTVDGQPHQYKVKLCGKEGQTDAGWLGTLKDAVDKLAANTEMPAPARAQITAALNAEIARLSGSLAVATAPATPPADLSRDYSSLPPIPPPSAAPKPAPILQPRAAPLPAPIQRDYASLPPLPAAPAAAPPPSLLAAPRLSFSCYAPGEIGDAPCIGFERETVLTVRALEDVPAGTSLRFVRNGEERGDVALAALRRGKSVRLGLPREVCSGFGDGRLEVRTVRAATVVGTEGPYTLRC